MTVRETYDKVYAMHYKFLTDNHMAEDRAKRSATLQAVRNTWKIHNRRNNARR